MNTGCVKCLGLSLQRICIFFGRHLVLDEEDHASGRSHLIKYTTKPLSQAS